MTLPETASETSSSSSSTLQALVTALLFAGGIAIAVIFFAFTTTNTPASVDGTSATSMSPVPVLD